VRLMRIGDTVYKVGTTSHQVVAEWTHGAWFELVLTDTGIWELVEASREDATRYSLLREHKVQHPVDVALKAA